MKDWYRSAIIYSLDVRTFMDGNADGIGDISGLLGRLDYLHALGVNCLWLLPFYPAAQLDGGYDVLNHYKVDPAVGDEREFMLLVEEAHKRDMRILLDLVVNHTSNRHPWFQEARRDPYSYYRNYYIWLPEKPANPEEDIIFGDVQQGNWEYDEVAKQYYYHTFYQHQPDLNIANPAVQEEIKKILQYWLELGADGFRVDAVPHMLRRKGNESFLGEPHAVFRQLRSFVSQLRPEAVLLAEADTEPQAYNEFLESGEEFHLLFNFYMNNYLFLSLARQDAGPVIRAVQELQQQLERWPLANFVRNHDELDLERLSSEEREEVFRQFAPLEAMRAYGRGIRRRLPAMLKNNRAQLELVYSLLLSLPGAPVLLYGEELGMGDDLTQKERHSVRTLMQWSDAPNAGFSMAPAARLYAPVIDSGEYAYTRLNVVQQLSDPASLLNWMSKMIAARRKLPVISRGDMQLIPVSEPAVMAHQCRQDYDQVVIAHNFSARPCTVTLPVKITAPAGLYDVFTGEPVHGRELKVQLPAFGYRWLSSAGVERE